MAKGEDMNIGMLFPDQVDKYNWRKDQEVMKYLHWLSVTYSIAYLNGEYKKAASALILWINGLYPLIDQKKTYGEEKKETVKQEFIRAIIELDKFIDMKTVDNASLKSFNNRLIRYERELRCYEMDLGIYLTRSRSLEVAFNA